jgi:8-oxo-dGTP diphosphatase
MSQSDTLQADTHLPRQGGADRPVTEVAVGILIREDGALLVTTRPAGKAYAGYWEFPGGKLESGETIEQALRRELQEEIGVTIGPAPTWHIQLVDYPHALVRLHFCKVLQWSGALCMREGQHYAWQVFNAQRSLDTIRQQPLDVHPVLPGAIPVFERLHAELFG